MNSFPTIKKKDLQDCFDKLVDLYQNNQIKIVEAAEKATIDDQNPIIRSLNSDLGPQIRVVRGRIGRVADFYGQFLLVRWIEELYEDLESNGAVGITIDTFFSKAKIVLENESVLSFNADRKWKWAWLLVAEEDRDFVVADLRKAMTPKEKAIVPGYVLQFVQQATSAHKDNRPAAALSLMSIALEGTLRDALAVRGYTYTPGRPSNDVYKSQNIHVHKDTNGFKVTFPEPGNVPFPETDYLSANDEPTYKSFKIRRAHRNNRVVLELRDVDDLIGFWSSDTVIEEGTMQIGGLGTAIEVARNHAQIIDPVILPPDMDDVIKAIRNNLIHLSGDAMEIPVIRAHNGRPSISLGEYLNNKNRIFDTISSIGETINVLYNKIASGTL